MVESPWKGLSSAEGILGGKAPTGTAQAAQTVRQRHAKPEGRWQWPCHLSPPWGVRPWGFLWDLLDPADGTANSQRQWHVRVVPPSRAQLWACGWQPWTSSSLLQVLLTCLACAPRRGLPVSAAAAGCGETRGKGGAETGGHEQAAEDVRREAPDPCSFTFCHTREMVLTCFFNLSPKAGARLGMVEGGETGVLRLTVGQGKRRRAMLFVRWDASGFDCLVKYPGRQLRCHLPCFGWQHQGLWRQELPWGPWRWGHSPYTYRPESGMFMRRKYFKLFWGGGKKKTVKIVFSFVPSPSWLSRKIFWGLWPIFYLIIKGKNIAFGDVSASLSKSNILNI